MAKRSDEKQIRKITKTGGGSYYVTIPIELIRKFNWREGQKVTVTKDEDDNKVLKIEDWEE